MEEANKAIEYFENLLDIGYYCKDDNENIKVLLNLVKDLKEKNNALKKQKSRLCAMIDALEDASGMNAEDVLEARTKEE